MSTNTGIDFFEHLLSFSGSGTAGFIDILLAETINRTKSKKGFLCFYPIDDYSQCFIMMSGKSPGMISKDEYSSSTEFPGPWHDSINLNKVIILNTYYSVDSTQNRKIYGIQFNRLCVMPLLNSDGLSASLVLSGKNDDYDSADRELMESIKRPVSELFSLLLKMETLDRTRLEAIENNNRKNLYLTNFVHEIKTPLNALAGFSQLLKEPDLKEQNMRKYLDIITRTSDTMISLIRYFNEISEIETGKIRIIDSEVRLFDLINDLYNKFIVESQRNKLDFKKEILINEQDFSIFTDGVRLKQVLEELLSNAFSYTFTGSVVLRCELKGNMIEFCISDTGIGIPENRKAGVFDYSRSENSLIKNAKGSGLGLIISKSYIEMMGGRIWFESVEGKGTAFYFTIPYKTDGQVQTTKSVVENETRKRLSGKKTILVAEDDNLNFTLIKNFLSNLNVEIIRAENGKIAVDIFSERHIDLILMDIKMPVMDGYSAVKIIKGMNSSVNIIAQTAYSNDRSEAISVGCDNFIAKPFGKQQLLSLVSAYI
jgi:signal transduction histidine kinase